MSQTRVAFGVAGASPLLVGAIAFLGCSQSTVILPSRDLDRPTDMAFTCMDVITDDAGGLRLAARPMGQCHPSGVLDPMPPPALDPGTAGTQHRTYAFVTNTDRGDLSVIDMSYCRPGDATCWPPGAALVDLDPTLVGYAAAPLGVFPEVVAASQDGCRLVSANRGSCDLTLVNPEVLLTPHVVSAVNAGHTTQVTPDPLTPDINAFATTVVPVNASGPLNLAPGEIAFLPQQTGNLPSGKKATDTAPATYCDLNGTFAAPVGTPPVTDATPPETVRSVPWRAIVTFPSCDLIALIELPSGRIVDSYQVGAPTGGTSYSFLHSGSDPICPRVDCGSSSAVVDAGIPDADTEGGAADVPGADTSEDDASAPDASNDDAGAADDGGSEGGAGDAGAAVVVAPTGRLGISALAIHPEGKRVYFGASSAAAIGALDIDGDTLVPAPSTEIHGAGGATRIRLSVDPFAYSKGFAAADVARPEYGRFVAGPHDIDTQDPPLEFLYVIARDGSLRVLDVAGAGGRAPYECDLAIDPTDPLANALGDEPAVRTPCFAYPPVAGGPRRLPYAGGPGLRLGGTLQDIAFANYFTPHAVDLTTDESMVNGAFAFAMTTTGAVYVINIDPEPRNIKQIRNGLPGRFPESPRPLTNSLRDVNVVSYSTGLGPQTGPPRIDTPPTTLSTGPSIQTFTTKETAINALVVPTATTVNGQEMLTLPSGVTDIPTYVYFPNRATVNAQQWLIAWEGDLTGVRSTGDVMAASGQFTDNGAGFCALGALPGDLLTLVGCNDMTTCRPGTVCVTGTGVPSAVDGRSILGLCLDQNRVEELKADAVCGRLLKTFRRYEITKPSDSALFLLPKKDEVPRPVFTDPDTGERVACRADADCQPDGDSVHAGFMCVPVSCTPSATQVCDPASPTRRCLKTCATDAGCRQGRVCFQYQQGKFCAEADTINPTCFQQLVQYKISAGNTFIVSGSAVGRVESVQETAGMEGPFCTNNVTSPLVAARIPMNTQECDQAIHLFDDPDTGGRGPSGQLIDTAIRDTKPAPHVPCFITETAAKPEMPLNRVPHVTAFFENAEMRLVLKDLDRQITDGWQIRFEVHGGVGPQFVSPSADSAPGLPARILLGPVPQPDQNPMHVTFPVDQNMRPYSDLPYLFVVDQRQFSGGRLGPRGQVIRITPRIADTIPYPGFETFAGGGKYFPIQ